MAKFGGSVKSDSNKSYRERRKGGRDRTAAFADKNDKTTNKLYTESEENPGIGDAKQVYGAKTPIDGNTDSNSADKKTARDFNLKQEKGADLQQEAGAELATKNRLKTEPGIDLGSGNLPTYGNGIKNQRKYRKHAAKVKEYAQPYKSSLVDDTDDKRSSGKPGAADVNADDDSETAGTLYTPDSPIAGKNCGKLSEKPSKPEYGENTPSPKNSAQGSKLSTEPKNQPAQTPKNQIITEGSRWSAAADDDSRKSADGHEKNKGSILSEAANSNKLKTEKSKLVDTPQGKPGAQPKSKLKTHTKNIMANAPPISPSNPGETISHDAQSLDTGTGSPEIQDKQKELNRKKQLAAEHISPVHEGKPGERFINTDKSAKSINYQHRLHDKADKLVEKGSKLRVKQEEAIAAMPTKDVTIVSRVYDEKTGKVSKLKTTEKRTLHQNEARWNNPKFTDKLKNAEGFKEKAKVIAADAGKKGATFGMVAAVGGVPGAAGVLVAKPTLEYGSKLLVNEAHRQVRKDIRQNGDNEVLKVAHWAEQKGERALGQGIRRLNPVAVRRYIKNAPYRRESKLKIKELKNDKKLGLLRVKQDKASGVNHMTGKKSNVLTRAWQRRQIKKNYVKAMMAAGGKGGGSIGFMARELARGNPKAIAFMIAKKIAAKIAIVAAKFIAKITIFNPVFWKILAVVLLIIIILLSVHACVAIFSPAMAGMGTVSDEDISYSTRIYSEWEVDMRLFVDSANVVSEFPPPAHITGQSGVIGEIIYPEPPYTPPSPFYEYRFEIGMIRHDPMELISYLTARHGDRFSEDSENPMTRSALQTLLAEIFEAQYGIAPGEFDNLIHEEVETRFRIERRVVTEIRYDGDGIPYEHTETVYEGIYYQFWILTVRLESRSLSEVLRSRMTADEEAHFDVLNLTGNGRQVVGNPFDFNWIPNITSHYGYRIHPISNEKRMHMGIDIGASLGTPLFATHTGTITQVQFSDTGYGNMIRLTGEGADGLIYETLFAHLHEIHVTDGQEVGQGDLIGTVGSSGDSTGLHLHLEVFRLEQQATINGETVTLSAMRLNPLFAVITWTDDEGNENFRPLPGEGGASNSRPPFFPSIPPEAMSDERFVTILTEASRHLGARYVWGGAGPTTFDCSGFIHFVFTNALSDWTHGRTTAQGYFNLSTPVTAENARPGDLVFFTGTHSGAFITHVGIYIGGGQMIHTGGNPAGVEFVSINTPFWQRHFHAFARV
ncbi:MAG: NlpC/P60 family protein [Defluviitaleaceae bacterium]|nr:NlpC/P60 family protein [Defluviitaleaceae bacterium]